MGAVEEAPEKTNIWSSERCKKARMLGETRGRTWGKPNFIQKLSDSMNYKRRDFRKRKGTNKVESTQVLHDAVRYTMKNPNETPNISDGLQIKLVSTAIMCILFSKTQIFLKESFFMSHFWLTKMDTVNLALISLFFSSIAAKMGH